jgi:EKC/KEOPS complex subunit CGI121/TPRKB
LPIKTDGSIDASVTYESVSEHLGSAVQGTSVDLSEDGSELGRAAEVHKIKKTYKITCAKGGKKGAKGINGDAGKKDDRSDIEAVILGTIALKGS